MATITRGEIVSALEHLGRLAEQNGVDIERVVIGGAAMVLAYGARLATRDVDVVIAAPRETAIVRRLARIVATERDWPDDWLNDAAKGYLVGVSDGAVLLSVPGLRVRAPSVAQLLAMKLSAWRDDIDVADARRLLREMADSFDRVQVWREVEPYLVPGDELKAQFAFDDLWEALYGDIGSDR